MVQVFRLQGYAGEGGEKKYLDKWRKTADEIRQKAVISSSTGLSQEMSRWFENRGPLILVR